MKFFRTTILALTIMSCFSLSAQENSAVNLAKAHLEKNLQSFQLTLDDLKDLKVSDEYTTDQGNTYLYLQQCYGGIPIYNAVNTFYKDKSGQIYAAPSRFFVNLQQKVQPLSGDIIEPIEAIIQTAKSAAVEQYKLPIQKGINRKNSKLIFDKSDLAHSDIFVKKVYVANENDQLVLAWQVELDAVNGTDYWNMLIDAQTGKLLNKGSYTTHCSFDGHSHEAGQTSSHTMATPEAESREGFGTVLAGESRYNVWGLPLEAPSFGSRSFQNGPASTLASPYGWHDINGQDGAEFQITRGNNVHAFHDADANYVSANDEPSGGAALSFDQAFDPSLEPTSNSQTAIIQLFYMVNMMHDIAYANGLTEAAGSFQTNNYGKGGLGDDEVNALGQFDSNIKTSRNNADFSTPEDGGNGRMRMFLWDRTANSYLTVLTPASISGVYASSTSTFSPTISTTPITGKVVPAYDISSKPTLGCAAIENSIAVSGNVALIDRGSCFFKEKAIFAQNAGAIGLIICNFEEALVSMGGTTPTATVNIPVVMLEKSKCTAIREKITRGEDVSISFVTPNVSGPAFLDGTIDNGIIAHEYGHGISNRLTGGPSLAGCLGNDEQMGEGWSDFFTLVTTAKSTDTKEKIRGIGTYADNQPITGRGIRSYPYTTDMNDNPETYESIIGVSGPHPLGATWAAMLWEVYWKMVEKYGFNPDLINGNAGNNKAIKLVMEGMKLQPCSPGFVDGRNAILKADEVLYGGENKCLLWEAFAKRGLGYLANQGSNNQRNDALESFEVLPTCIPQLKIIKKATEFIKPGENITVNLTVVNHKNETLNNLVVSDIIPNGCTYVAGSASQTPTITGNLMSFNINSMAFGDTLRYKYVLKSSPDIFSDNYFFDDAESSQENFDFVIEEGSNQWYVSVNDTYKGSLKYKVNSFPTSSLQNMQMLDPIQITGENPELRFFYKINTENGADGGIIEYSDDNGVSWSDLGSRITRNGYRGKISYSTFVIPNLKAYWGNSGTAYKEVHVDLADFKNKSLRFRFSFATNDTSGTNSQFWAIDNIELVDAKYYQTRACVSVTGGEMVCSELPSKGTYIESEISLKSKDQNNAAFDAAVYPNPGKDLLSVFIQSVDVSEDYEVSIFNIQGQKVINQKLVKQGLSSTHEISTTDIPEGMYLVRLKSKKGEKTIKWIKH